DHVAGPRVAARDGGDAELLIGADLLQGLDGERHGDLRTIVGVATGCAPPARLSVLRRSGRSRSPSRAPRPAPRSGRPGWARGPARWDGSARGRRRRRRPRASRAPRRRAAPRTTEPPPARAPAGRGPRRPG